MASKNHITVGHRAQHMGPPQCLGCRRPIYWGERCEACKRELRRRLRRKPR